MKTKCYFCKHVRYDPTVVEGKRKPLMGLECGNKKSEYYRDLLNVTPNGDLKPDLQWSGCAAGEIGKNPQNSVVSRPEPVLVPDYMNVPAMAASV